MTVSSSSSTNQTQRKVNEKQKIEPARGCCGCVCVFSVCMDVQVCTHVHLLLHVLYGVHTCLRACVCLHVYVTCSVCVCVCAHAYLLLGSVFLTAACTHRHGVARLPWPCKFNPWPGILEETRSRAPCPVTAAARELALTWAKWGLQPVSGPPLSCLRPEWESPSSTTTALTVAARACPWGRRSKHRPSDPRPHCSFSTFKCLSDTWA